MTKEQTDKLADIFSTASNQLDDLLWNLVTEDLVLCDEAEIVTDLTTKHFATMLTAVVTTIVEMEDNHGYPKCERIDIRSFFRSKLCFAAARGVNSSPCNPPPGGE